ncbi:hypothetical protein [uncultured Gammaproteobacteria bacterium]|nr:hypothetical protein [uncultured Gammaproteobacteria bacterium]CAC9657631.1 hypothetical protein [uncultured Gammaproteobacteria bacterium]
MDGIGNGGWAYVYIAPHLSNPKKPKPDFLKNQKKPKDGYYYI